ncbi:universal stress protein [Arcticibacter tournemirensis]|uniref:Universal stress protein n=1 Tax=Arcticibacter tournemirensis TaxID=699437 RepID=A0A4Q0MBH5_9SPHI|nr:universal stress protein [Arcticibacter tournemirensis]RXF70651.1 universal stress protein [Arcticibacter tournemirensis]
MKTILILTDFSDPSLNAARYAAGLSSELNTSRIILYHSFLPLPMATELPVPPPLPSEDPYGRSNRQLNALKDELSIKLSEGAHIETRTGEGPFVSSVMSLVRDENIDMVVMGTSAKGTLERIIMGSNTLELIRKCKVPLLVIPPEAIYKPVHVVAFASDLKDVSDKTPVLKIKPIIDLLNARLLVFNVSEEGVGSFHTDLIKEQKELHERWDAESVEYHYVNHKDIAEGIMRFAEDNNVQLVIVIPGKHEFFESFFHRSISKKLAYHTRIPLLIVNTE